MEEDNNDKLFYIDLNNEDNRDNKSNKYLIYNSIFHDCYIIDINSKIYIITINNNNSEIKQLENNNKEETTFISFAKKMFYKITKSNILYLTEENEININNLNIKKLNILSGIIEKKQIKKISCSIDETLFLTLGGMIYYQKEGDKNQKLILDLLEYSTEDICSGENFHMANCKKRNDDKNLNYIFTWGDNSCRQCGINDRFRIDTPSEILNNIKIKKIALGKRHSCILLNNGNIIIFGDNTYNQSKINTEEPLVLLNKDKSINYNYFLNSNENIIDIKTSAYSTMFISDKGSILFIGKIYNNQPIIFQKKIKDIKNEISLSDENWISINNNNNNNIYSQLNNIQILEEEISNDLNESDIDEFSYNKLLQEQNISTLTSTKPTENSMTELRSYINILNISLSSNFQEGPMSFRPENLPPKTKEEEEKHRKLVLENREMYKKQIKLKQEMEKIHLKKLEIKHENDEKRANYWLKEILPNWNIMKSNKNFKHYFYEGIPQKIRGRIWMLCIGNKFSITKDYYNIEVIKSIKLLLKNKKSNNKNNLNEEEEENFQISQSNKSYSQYIIQTRDKEKSINLIDLDIERTFFNLGVFKNNSPESEDLREILRAFVISRPEIGYVQGLSYVAGTLILQMEKFQSFICLMNIILNPSILPFYRLDEKKIKSRLELFQEIFFCNLPKLYNHFFNLDIIPEHFLIEWFMTLYSRSLSVELTFRIWDVYMIEGICTLYKTAIVILNYYEENFLKMDFEEIVTTLQQLSNIKLTEDEFIDGISNVKFTDKIMDKINSINEDYFSGE